MDDEDKSLDDFFAKKDKGKKGKSKTKGKFNTSSMTKQVGNPQNANNEKSKEQKPVAGQSSNSQNEDEWEDFNEPKEKDYSGLKVQSFQTLDKQNEDVDEKAERDEECDGEDASEKKEKASGVWQAKAQPPSQAAPVEEPVKEEVKKEPVKGAYVPPSRRNMPSQPDVKDQSWKYGSNRRVDPRRPPEISSEIAFPSLQASADASNKGEAMSSLSFEPVKHGVRAGNTEQSVNRRMNIDLENKYDALSR